MQEKYYGDVPRIPKGLNKQAPLETDVPKRAGRLKIVRHKVKEILKYFKTK